MELNSKLTWGVQPGTGFVPGPVDSGVGFAVTVSSGLRLFQTTLETWLHRAVDLFWAAYVAVAGDGGWTGAVTT